MNPHEAVEPLSSIVKPLPWELADFVAYFLLGAVLPATLYMAIAGVPAFLQSAEANPIRWGVLVAVFAYPLGVILFSIGQMLRRFFAWWIPDKRHKTSLERLKNRANHIASALEQLVFNEKVGGDIVWYFGVATLIAPNYLPHSARNLQRQNSFYRFHTTLLAVVLLNAAVLLTVAVLRLTGAPNGQWLPFVGYALLVAGLAIVIEYVAREHNNHILVAEVELAAALLAVLNERRRTDAQTETGVHRR